MQKKTIKQWFEELPEPHRSQALANMWWEDQDKLESSAARALHQGFKWGRTPEGIEYWGKLHRVLLKAADNKISAE